MASELAWPPWPPRPGFPCEKSSGFSIKVKKHKLHTQGPKIFTVFIEPTPFHNKHINLVAAYIIPSVFVQLFIFSLPGSQSEVHNDTLQHQFSRCLYNYLWFCNSFKKITRKPIWGTQRYFATSIESLLIEEKKMRRRRRREEEGKRRRRRRRRRRREEEKERDYQE